MKLKFRKKVLLAKIQTAAGTDAEPTGALNAILTRDLTIEPLVGEELRRELDKPYLGNDLSTMVGKHVSVTFKVELAGAGDAGDLPAYGPLIRGCGHSETLDDDITPTQVEYVPVDDEEDQPQLTLYVNIGGKKLHKIIDARGSLRITGAKRQYGYYEFTFMGIFLPVESLADPIAGVFSAFQRPVPFRASTVEASILGVTVGLHSLTINCGQQVAFYDHSEEESIQIEDRNASAECSFEDDDPDTTDFIGLIDEETAGPLSYVHGTEAGNIVEIESPLFQPMQPRYADENGILGLQVSGPLVADGTDPDYRIIVR